MYKLTEYGATAVRYLVVTLYPHLIGRLGEVLTQIETVSNDPNGNGIVRVNDAQHGAIRIFLRKEWLEVV